MRNVVKSLVEKIKDYELKYNSDKSKETKKELEFLLDELFREIDSNNTEENTYILNNIISITTKIFSGFGLSALLLESPRMKVGESIWSILLNNNLVKQSKTKTLNYQINPQNENLEKIFDYVVSTDELRPALLGINFESNFATGTDAFKLLHLEGNRVGNFQDGTYYLYSVMEKTYNQLQDKKGISFDKYYNENRIIDARFPNWIAVVPKTYDFKKTFDLENLNGILKTFYKNRITNSQTNCVAFEFQTKDGKYHIGFNAEFLSQMCESLIMAGEKMVDIYFGLPSKAVVILSNNKEFPTEKKAEKFFKENTFGLIMPIMLNLYEDSFEEDLKNYPLIKYNDIYDYDITIGDSPTYNTLGKTKKTKSDLYSDLIEGYELALELETNAKKIKLFKDIIEGYKLALELE